MKILIVGAGIAGLAMARALQQKGISFEIVEASLKDQGGAGIFLLGNATRALRDISMLKPILDVASPIASQRIYSARGGLLNEVFTESVWHNCGPCISLTRGALVAAFRSSLSGTEIEYGTRVESLQSVGRRSRVWFSDGRIGHYDLVIGADGIRSAVRGTLDTTTPRALGITCWRGLVDRQSGVDGWTAMLGKNQTLLAVPVSQQKMYLYADCPTNVVERHPELPFRERFAAFQAPLGAMISDLHDSTVMYRAELEAVSAVTLAVNNCVLIGDAAHASSPSMAQGAGMALEDAVVLAEMLFKGQELSLTLSNFSKIRKHRVDWVQAQSLARDKLRNSPSFLRNAVLRYFGSSLYNRSYRPLTRHLF